MKSVYSEPLPKVFSTSQIGTYATCPRQYAYRYVLKIPTLVTPPALVTGSRIHAAIATGDSLDDTVEQTMVNRARQVLAELPPNPVIETTYEDRNNPGRFFGDVCGERFIGIFDAHWPADRIAVDWKTGKYHPRYTASQDLQAYVLGELFTQAYSEPLAEFRFEFLKDAATYRAKSLVPGRSRTKAQETILTAVSGIRARSFEPCTGKLCAYCEHAGVCKLNVGFAEP